VNRVAGIVLPTALIVGSAGAFRALASGASMAAKNRLLTRAALNGVTTVK
jgi:hypothetical protein